MGTALSNTMFKMLDGQECRLASKYSKVFTKTKNVPVVLIANEVPRSICAYQYPFKQGSYG